MAYLTLSLLGMYRQAPEILDENHLLLPEGVDRETIQTLILTETAELEVMYPDPVTMAAVVKAWSYARKPSWERMLAALTEQYNPLHNYDRHEEESTTGSEDTTGRDTDTGTVTHAITGTEAMAKTGTEAMAKTGTVGFSGQQSTTGQETAAVTGYNASTLADDTRKSSTGSGTDQGTTTHNTTDTTTHNTTDTTTHNTQDQETRNLVKTRSGQRESSGDRELHAYGNIGVTTAAEMLTGELEVRANDIYRIISREFARYFCLLVY